MSWLKTSVIAVVTLILMAFGSQAFAEHVDWSSYIDHSAPTKAPVAQSSSSVVSDDAPVAKSSKKANKRVAKKASSKRKVKARAKKGHR